MATDRSGSFKMLLVDDDATLADALSLYLESENVHVTIAESCQKALQLVTEDCRKFDMILCDLLLPDGDGFLVIRAAKKEHRGIVAVVMTGYASMKSAIEAIRLGAYDYVIKPFTLDEIEILVRNIRDKINLERENREGKQKLEDIYQRLDSHLDEKIELMRVNREMKREFERLSEKLDQVIGLLRSSELLETRSRELLGPSEMVSD